MGFRDPCSRIFTEILNPVLEFLLKIETPKEGKSRPDEHGSPPPSPPPPPPPKLSARYDLGTYPKDYFQIERASKSKNFFCTFHFQEFKYFKIWNLRHVKCLFRKAPIEKRPGG